MSTFSSPVYRAIVTYSNTSTGQIIVRIPALTGASSTVELSKIGRSSANDYWVVPQVGEQIIVTADDANFTNAFWLQTDPFNPESFFSTRILYPSQYAFVEGPTSGGGTGILQFTGTRYATGGMFSTSASGITVNRRGRYRIDAAYRSSGADTYAYLGVSGDRATLEGRDDSGWTHDHASYSQQHTHSSYIGFVEAGWTITLGASNGNVAYAATGFAGYIFIFYIGE